MNDYANFDGTNEWPERYLADAEIDTTTVDYAAEQAYFSVVEIAEEYIAAGNLNEQDMSDPIIKLAYQIMQGEN